MNFETTLDRDGDVATTVVYGLDYDDDMVPQVTIGQVIISDKTYLPDELDEDELLQIQEEAWEHYVLYSQAIRELVEE